MRVFVALVVAVLTLGAGASAQDIDAPSTVMAFASDSGAANEVAEVAGSSAFIANVVPVQPIVAVSTPKPEQVKTHKFFDRKTWALSALTASAALADGITTQHALGLRRTTTSTVNGIQTTTVTTYVEKNPIAKPLVDRGWPGQIAATALTVSADLGVRAYLHKRGHHKLERIVPILFAATNASFAAHNAGHW